MNKRLPWKEKPWVEDNSAIVTQNTERGTQGEKYERLRNVETGKRNFDIHLVGVPEGEKMRELKRVNIWKDAGWELFRTEKNRRVIYCILTKTCVITI